MLFKESERVKGEEGKVKIAVVQMPVLFGKVKENLARAASLARQASIQGAELIIFPELCTTGYVFNSRREAAALAEPVPDGESTVFWRQLASELNVYLVAGLAEKEDSFLYNTAILVDPAGFVGRYRKLHLFNEEKLFFEPGNLGLPVFNLPWGRIGLILCYDLRFFETGRILMIRGADLICVPTNWVTLFDRQGFDQHGYAMQHYAAMVMANTNQIFIACADRIGRERGTEFLGKSILVGPSGWPLCGPASVDQEEILISDINLSEARLNKSRNQLDDIIKDRRRDVYDEMLGYVGPS